MEPVVLIDPRAGSKDLVKYPPLDTIGTHATLEGGDAAIVGNGPDGPVLVGVELKSIPDFIQSTDTGRLQATQIPKLLADYCQPWLLLYGRYYPTKDGGLRIMRKGKWARYRLGTREVPYGYIEQMLLTINAVGVRVRTVESKAKAALWIGELARWWSKPWAKHKGMKVFDRSRSVGVMPDMNSGVHLRARVAMQFKGMGYERAVAAAKYFGSVRAMVGAGAGEWAKVEGVGKVVAQSITEEMK